MLRLPPLEWLRDKRGVSSSCAFSYSGQNHLRLPLTLRLPLILFTSVHCDCHDIPLLHDLNHMTFLYYTTSITMNGCEKDERKQTDDFVRERTDCTEPSSHRSLLLHDHHVAHIVVFCLYNYIRNIIIDNGSSCFSDLVWL